MSGPDGAGARVHVLVRDGCHLCEDAVAVVSAVCTAAGQEWSLEDVDADADRLREFGELVPVVFVDGVRHAVYRVDRARLREALTA